MSYEEQVKEKLFGLWKKQPIRIKKLNNGWEQRKVNLGKGIIKNSSEVSAQDMISIIEDFGIKKEKIKELNMNYDQIVNTYHAINAYRLSIKFLKDLRMKIDLFKRYD